MNLIKHPEFGEIRTVAKNKETWFVANDICDVLDLQGKGSHNLSSLDNDEKDVQKIYTPGGPQEMVVVNESGLYALIMRSNKPAARKFRKWVTSEVLPAIRKQGFYVHPDYMDKTQARKLHAEMAKMIEQYLTYADIAKICKRFNITDWHISHLMKGSYQDNAVMQEMQCCALANKEVEINAYPPERMQKIIQKLNS